MLFKKIHSVYPAEASIMNENSSKEPSEMVDLEDRDPHKLSQHLQVSWEDIIGEPNAIRSPECAWTVSNHCFNYSKNCCYICLSVICAPLTAFCLGVAFACLSFEYIWCSTPCLRIWKISCAVTRNFVVALMHATIIPCTSACGYLFSEIKVKTQAVSDETETETAKKEDFLLV